LSAASIANTHVETIVKLDAGREGFEEALQDVGNNQINSKTFARLFAASNYQLPTNEPEPWYSLVIAVYIPAAFLIVAAGFAALSVAAAD
jgi:hypothetical protein